VVIVHFLKRVFLLLLESVLMSSKRDFQFVDGGDGIAMGAPAAQESKRFKKWVDFFILFVNF